MSSKKEGKIKEINIANTHVPDMKVRGLKQ